MFGQGIMPEHYHQSTRAMKEKDLGQFLSTLRTTISQTVAQLPSHQEFVNQYCKASRIHRLLVGRVPSCEPLSHPRSADLLLYVPVRFSIIEIASK